MGILSTFKTGDRIIITRNAEEGDTVQFKIGDLGTILEDCSMSVACVTLDNYKTPKGNIIRLWNNNPKREFELYIEKKKVYKPRYLKKRGGNTGWGF